MQDASHVTGEVEPLFQDLRIADLSRLRRVLQMALIHDLKAPLNTATLVLDLLGRSLAQDDPAAELRWKQLENVEEIRRELRRLGDALPDLLSFPDPGAGKTERVDLVERLPHLLRLLRQQALIRNVRVRTEFPDTPLPVLSRDGGLEHAFLALVVNALEAMPHGGTLTVRARRAKGEVLCLVSDEGPGPPIELGDRVWERHVTSKEGHSGLGLFVAKRILEEHGGSVRLAPGEIGGTDVEARLPLVTGAAKTTSMESPECPTHS